MLTFLVGQLHPCHRGPKLLSCFLCVCIALGGDDQQLGLGILEKELKFVLQAARQSVTASEHFAKARRALSGSHRTICRVQGCGNGPGERHTDERDSELDLQRVTSCQVSA